MNKKYSLIFLIFCFCALSGLSSVSARPDAGLVFIENRGQLIDQYRAPRHDLDFFLRTPGVNLFVGAGRLHYQFVQTERVPGNAGLRTASKHTVYRLDMELAGADLNVRPVPGKAHAYAERYYTGQHAADIRSGSWQQVTYPEVYPNIDWVLYVKDDGIKYDFVLHAGANPSDIRIRYKGASAEQLQDDGSLHCITPFGTITEHPPVAWQQEDRKPVACAFVRQGDAWTFETDHYTGAMVIDPWVQWGTYYGGSDEESQGPQIATITSDASGKIYVAGQTASIDLIATTGVHQTTLEGSGDVFLAAFRPDGSLAWGTYYGGSDDEEVWGIATGATGHVYIAGITSSTTGIATNGSHKPGLTGAFPDNFLAQFDTLGNLVWGTYYGDAEDESGGFVTTDRQGNVYLAGTTFSASGIATAGTHQPVKSASPISDAYVAKFNAAGQRIWGTYYGGPGAGSFTGANAVAADRNDAVLLMGMTNTETAISTAGVHQQDFAGVTDAFIVKFDTSGQRLWGTYYGGSEQEMPFAMTVGPDNDVYIAGLTYSDTGIATPGASRSVFNMNPSLSMESFLAKFNSSGARVWGTYAGPEMGEFTGGISADLCGNVYLSGATMGTSNIMITPDAHQSVFGGGADALLIRYSADSGQVQYSTYYGGADMDLANGVHVDRKGNVYLYGYTASTTDIATPGTHQPAPEGGYDMFLVKLLTLGIDPSFPDTTLCIDRAFLLPVLPSSDFNSGNVFTVELSDQAGSFASPVVIGTSASVAAGDIACTIPAGTTPGAGYRIRISATDPVLLSSCPREVTLVLPPSVPVITVNGATLESSASSGNQWWLGQQPVPGADSQVHTVTVTGWYRVQVSNAGCSSYSDSVYIEAPETAISHLMQDAPRVSLFPNPFEDKISIQIDASVTDVHTYRLTVADLTGRIVYTQPVTSYKNELNLEYLDAGIYLVMLRGAKGNVAIRVLKR